MIYESHMILNREPPQDNRKFISNGKGEWQNLKFFSLIFLFLVFLSKDLRAQSCCSGVQVTGDYRFCILVVPVEGYTYGTVRFYEL